MPQIVRGAVLRMVEPAAVDGETGFIDAIAAYARLSSSMKARIEHLEVVYQFAGAMTLNRFGFPNDLVDLRSEEVAAATIAKYRSDPVVHPMVITQRETGRKVLKLSPMHAKYILGMPGDESDALLTKLADHLTDPSHAYYHRCGADEVIVWDNCRMIHSAVGVPLDVPRMAQRTTIVGDYGCGRYLDPGKGREAVGLRFAD